MKLFPYEYISGGWFRRKGKPKGESSGDMLHGDHALAALEKQITERVIARFEESKYVWWSKKDILNELRELFNGQEHRQDER